MSRTSDLVFRYSAAVLAVTALMLLALLLRAALEPAWPGQVAGPLLLFGVAVAAWLGGHGPGLIAVLLALLGLEFLVSPPVFTLRFQVHDAPRLIAFLGASVLVSSLAAQRRRAETVLQQTDEELRAARTIQQRLFPAGPPTIPGIDVAGASIPASTVGGDYYDYIPLRDGATGIVVGDVSGHGLGPALLMAETRAYLRALAETHNDIARMLTITNRWLTHDTADEFVTLFFGSIDPRTRTFTYAGAGHEAYLIDPAGGVRRLTSTCLPLGLADVLDMPCVCGSPVTLAPGQVILVITDGVHEARSPDGIPFGIERSLGVVRSACSRSAQEIINCLTRELRTHADSQPQEDDITVVALKVDGGGRSARAAAVR